MMKRSKAIESRVHNAIEEKSALLQNIETASSIKIHPLRYHADRMVELEDVSIIYGERNICQGISFNIQSGDRIALCGKNGSGKSSMARLILGEPISYQGIIRRGSRLKISYISQDTAGLAGNLSDYAIEYGLITLSSKPYSASWIFQEVCSTWTSRVSVMDRRKRS